MDQRVVPGLSRPALGKTDCGTVFDGTLQRDRWYRRRLSVSGAKGISCEAGNAAGPTVTPGEPPQETNVDHGEADCYGSPSAEYQADVRKVLVLDCPLFGAPVPI